MNILKIPNTNRWRVKFNDRKPYIRTTFFHACHTKNLEDRIKKMARRAITYLEYLGWKKAADGIPKPVFAKDKNGKPKCIGEVREYSDVLLEMFLEDRKEYRGVLWGEVGFDKKGCVVEMEFTPKKLIRKILENRC